MKTQHGQFAGQYDFRLHFWKAIRTDFKRGDVIKGPFLDDDGVLVEFAQAEVVYEDLWLEVGGAVDQLFFLLERK